MTRRTVSMLLALALCLVMPGLASGAEPTPEEGDKAGATLRGPFGTVEGGPPSDPATAAPDDRALDTWMRSATLELITEQPIDPGSPPLITATSLDGGGSLQLELEEERWLKAPDVAGSYVVTVATRGADGADLEQAWLVEVPDREGSWDTLLEMPAIEGSLRAGADSVNGVRGHGCLVDMCQEVGLRPPVDSLQALNVAVGEPLELRLSDGSALTHWEGRLEPQPGTSAETRLAQATFDEPVTEPTLAGLEPAVSGDWLLEVRADFDRERGWQWYLFRLAAH
jgi:hypothetical protein